MSARGAAAFSARRARRSSPRRERSATNVTATTSKSASAGAAYRSTRGAKMAASHSRRRAGFAEATEAWTAARLSNSPSTPAARARRTTVERHSSHSARCDAALTRAGAGIKPSAKALNSSASRCASACDASAPLPRGRATTAARALRRSSESISLSNPSLISRRNIRSASQKNLKRISRRKPAPLRWTFALSQLAPSGAQQLNARAPQTCAARGARLARRGACVSRDTEHVSLFASSMKESPSRLLRLGSLEQLLARLACRHGLGGEHRAQVCVRLRARGLGESARNLLARPLALLRESGLDALANLRVQARQPSARRRLVDAEHGPCLLQSKAVEVVEAYEQTVFRFESAERERERFFQRAR